MSMEQLFTVTIFDQFGRALPPITSLKEGQARMYVQENRPAGGASFIHIEGSDLAFKPYRRDTFKTERCYYFSPAYALRRPSNKQIEAAARRDPENAAALLELRK